VNQDSWSLLAQSARRGQRAGSWRYANFATQPNFILKTKVWHEFKGLIGEKNSTARGVKLMGMRDLRRNNAQTRAL